jgi:hypothetical protein
LTALPTDLIRRHLTVAATLTDEFTYGYIRSVSQTLTDTCTYGYIPSVKHDITDGTKSVSIFQAGNFFFGVQIPSVKPLANGFFVFPTDIATELGITDERKADRHNPLVKMSVNKSPTNCLSHTDRIIPSVKL